MLVQNNKRQMRKPNGGEASQSASKKRSRDPKQNSHQNNKKQKVDRSNDDDDEDDDDAEMMRILEELLEKTCKINFVSPLRISEIDQHSLKKISKQILIVLEETLSVHQNQRWIYHVTFKTVSGIKNGIKDSESLYFNILRRKAKHDLEDDEDENSLRNYSRVFHGLFTARGSTGTSVRHYKTRGSTYQNLPVLIYQGNITVWKSIEETLKSILSCHIIPFTFTTTAMKQITGRWIVIAHVKNRLHANDQINLSTAYPFSNGTIIKQEIQLHVKHLQDILAPWTRLNDVKADNITHFWDQLYAKYQMATQTNLHKFNLQKIGLKNFLISESGSFKARKPDGISLKDLLSSLTRTVESNNHASLTRTIEAS